MSYTAPDKWQQTVNLITTPVTVVQGTWAPSLDGNAWLNGNCANIATQNQNDAAIWQVDLAQGTWNFYLTGMSAPGAAIATIEYSQDGGVTWTSVGTLDLFHASTKLPFNNAVALSVVIPKTAKTLVRFKAATRNASANSWTLYLSQMIWQRTA